MPKFSKAVLLLILLAPLLIAIGLSVNNLLFLNKAKTTLGEVVEFQKTTSYKQNQGLRDETSNLKQTTYSPIVEFYTPENKLIRFTSGTGFVHTFDSWGKSYNIGDHVLVAYIPENPYEARIDDFKSLWEFAAIAGVMGIILWSPLALALIGKLYYYRKMHKEDPLNFPSKWHRA